MRVALLIALLLAPTARAAEVSRAGAHAFHSGFWINLHDRLRHDAREKTTPDDKAWRDAVIVYRTEVVPKDPLFDRTMVALTNRLAQIPDDGEPKGDSAIDKALRLAAPLYRATQWKEDDAVNRFWISVATTLLREAGPEITAELSRLYGVTWPPRLHIDVVPFDGRFGAYTPSGPPLFYTMVSSRDVGYQGFSALEMMFHEPLHHFDQHMLKLIDVAAKKVGIEPHHSLSHAILFYTSGDVAKRALARRGVTDYKPVAYRGIHERSWPELLPLLEEHWQAYIDGKVTRDEALEKMVVTPPKAK